MNTKLKLLVLTLLLCLNLPLHAIDINATSGSISVLNYDYVDEMSQEWNINTGTNRQV
ncbi:MAG: hypothetical protein PHT07_23465 [Paludibacter sp.]|nr:hypothetical protein [Paludibacter sp.]